MSQSKQSEVILFALDHFVKDNKVGYTPEQYEDLLTAFPGIEVSKYIKRLKTYLNDYTAEQIKYYYENRSSERDRIKVIMRNMKQPGNNSSNNQSSNKTITKSNNSKKQSKLALTQEEIIKLKRLISGQSNNEAITQGNNRTITFSNNRKKFTINLEIDLVNKAKEKAKEKRISLSEYINQIIFKDLK